jgi:DNA polymerase-4
LSLKHLNDVFGKSGQIYYNFARGIDDRKVITERERKSVGCEQTFLEDISLKSTVIIELYHTVLELEERVSRAGFEGKTLTLKVKYFDFTQISRSLTCNRILKTKADILPVAKKLLNQVDFSADKPIRLIGLSISNPSDGDVQILPKWTEGYLPFEK